ncbi:hypothetical protein Gotri_004832 [Gossypium trilobum]|uniref:Reverse transcriptase RNase H-like domain-containing protein n=1 Tax=Gossypium trilobum TaxID=34281 RepID=A0A7J9F650_9ROSI|nr:hypothetical protein [Gossypium trilobum]
MVRYQAVLIYDKEMLAVLLAVKKWHSYLVGRRFQIRTDHQSLKFLTDRQAITPFQQKWVVKMLARGSTVSMHEQYLAFVSENTNHLFFECSFIKSFWSRIFSWWDLVWKDVANVDEFCSLCWRMKLTCIQKSLWLLVIAASCWTEVDWWGRHKDWRSGRKLGRVRDFVWDPPPTVWLKFNVAGVVVEEVAGCGEVLRDEKGVVSALFSGKCGACGVEQAVVMTIKVATEIFIDLML